MLTNSVKLDLEIQAQKNRGILVVVSGPSAGVGKDAVVNKLKEKYGFSKITTLTTRPKREGERDGVDYHFVSFDEFERKRNENYFLEYEKYLDNYYGTPKHEVLDSVSQGKDVLLRIDVRGAKSVKKAIPASVLIYIAAPSFDTLKLRLEKRKDKSESIEKKLQIAIWEVEQFEGFDYLVVNQQDKLDDTVELVHNIIEAERRRVKKPLIPLH
jgi:guanylate kinase